MENWKEKIKRGDVAEVCRRIGVSSTNYYESQKIPQEKWTSAMFRLNIELKKMIEERENFIAETVL